MSDSYEHELTETPLENFSDFMKFIANNNLWDEAREACEKAGITTIRVSLEPIRVIQRLIAEDLLTNDRLDADGHRHALVINESSHSATTTTTTDAGTDAAGHVLKPGTSG